MRHRHWPAAWLAKQAWNWLGGAWRLLGWLFFHPSAWQRYLQPLDPPLTPLFALAELQASHWYTPRLRRLLLQGYLIAPISSATAVMVGLWLAGDLSRTAWLGLAFGLTLALLFGVFVSVGVGIAMSVLVSPSFALLWRGHTLLIDAATGLDFALIFGGISLLALHITRNLSSLTWRSAPLRQIGSILLGLLASALVVALALVAFATLTQSRQRGLIGDYGVGPTIATIPALVLGLALGWRARRWQAALWGSVIIYLLVMIAFGDAGSEFDRSLADFRQLSAVGLLIVLAYTLLFVTPYVLVVRLTDPWTAVIASAVGSLTIYPGIAGALGLYITQANLSWALFLVILGGCAHWWRPWLFYPFEAAWNALLWQLERNNLTHHIHWLHWHAVFWDELQRLPFYELDDHLVLLLENEPRLGQQTLAYVATTSQRWAAQAAQIEVDARRLERCQSVEEMAQIYQTERSGLIDTASAPLYIFYRHSEDIRSALNQLSLFYQRLALRDIELALEALVRELTRSREPYANRFRPIADHWRQVLMAQIETLTRQAEERQEIPNPYVVGTPLNRHQELFVGRADISTRLEALLRTELHPPLLLYGQRRMGKTSLLYNLCRLLPSRIMPILIDLQGPVSLANSHTEFLYGLATEMTRSATTMQKQTLPPLTLADLAHHPFAVFEQWFDQIEKQCLTDSNSLLLLMLDEFEALDEAMHTRRLNEQAVLGTLRHMIQHRPRLRLLLAGSHTFVEFQRWSAYLINAQVLHLGYLHEAEARQLIEQPIREFPLVYDGAASNRVLALTRGHPYLVQLLCSEIVACKNAQPPRQRRHVTVADVDSVIPDMLERGSQFFAHLAQKQINSSATTLLRFLAMRQAESPVTRTDLSRLIPDRQQLEQTIRGLQQQEIIEEDDQGYRFQVEAIRYWFMRNAS